MSFLKLAQSLNPLFENYVTLTDPINDAIQLQTSVNELHNSAVVDPRDSTLKLSNKKKDDIARPGDQNALDHSILIKRNLTNVKGNQHNVFYQL